MKLVAAEFWAGLWAVALLATALPSPLSGAAQGERDPGANAPSQQPAATVTPADESAASVVPEDAKAEPAEAEAETVPLPAEKPATDNNDAAQAKAEKLDPALVAETPQIELGQPATFSLYGAETFLRAAQAQYVLRDELGRQLARGAIAVANLPYTEGQPRQIQLSRFNVFFPLAGAGAQRASQRLFLEMSLEGPDAQRAQLTGSFLVSRNGHSAPVWDRWITLLSSPPPGGNWDKLRELGVTGGMQYRLHPARREALRKGNAQFFVENVTRQMLSRYHTEPGLWEKTIAAMQAGGSTGGGRAARAEVTPFAREPSLWAPEFADEFAREITRHAEVYAHDPPLFYSLASQPSMTRLAAAADFDFSPPALTEFQRWLERDVYGTLRALNDSWQTNFTSWADVAPMNTDEAMRRLKDGVLVFGPWIDFRDFQDFTFDKVLANGAALLREHHPGAKVGITGAMGPFAFGGWDWSRLSQDLDVVECYDIGGARELWRDLASGKPALALLALPRGAGEPAANQAATDAAAALWPLALEGGPRGVLLWDETNGAPLPQPLPPGGGGENSALLQANGEPTALARELSPLLKTFSGEVGELLARSARVNDGVAILYSPASIRLHWLLEAQRLHGDGWLAAWGLDTATERRESPQLRLRESWCKLLDDLGLGWRFVSSAQLEKELVLNPEAGIKTIVLPQAIALSDREVATLKQFAAGGGRVIADATCGRFDEHGRLRHKPALDELFGIDTSREPFFPQPMTVLDFVVVPQASRLPNAGGTPAVRWSDDLLHNLAPVFSDAPQWAPGRAPQGAEYRRSPVLAASPAGVYLNLDLTDYLRWRLHPGQPRAAAMRQALAEVAFAERLAAGIVDWDNTRLPAGTQLTWLRLPQAPQATLLALRRNPQARLHELGTEGDSNWAFEKPEPFVLALHKPAGVHTLYLPGAAAHGLDQQEAALLIKGVLDPVAPSLYVLRSGPPPALGVIVPPGVRQSETLEVKISSQGGKVCASFYSVHVSGPDGAERVHYGGACFAADGAWTHAFPFALNDPPGVWRVNVRDLLNGSETTVAVTLHAAE